MPKPLTRQRRLTVIAASLCASSSALMATSHAGATHVSRMYTLAGIVTGMVFGGAVLLFRRNRSLCE